MLLSIHEEEEEEGRREEEEEVEVEVEEKASRRKEEEVEERGLKRHQKKNEERHIREEEETHGYISSSLRGVVAYLGLGGGGGRGGGGGGGGSRQGGTRSSNSNSNSDSKGRSSGARSNRDKPHSTHSIPFHTDRPESYDIWSVGVVFLEMILGTADVFSVDPRTAALVTHRLQQGPDKNNMHIRKNALLLSSLADYCIYHPGQEIGDDFDEDGEGEDGEEEGMREGYSTREMERDDTKGRALVDLSAHTVGGEHLPDMRIGRKSTLSTDAEESSLPHTYRKHKQHKAIANVQQRLLGAQGVYNPTTSNPSEQLRVRSPPCGPRELHNAIIRRDPLGLGFEDRWGLDLLSRLLRFDPMKRINMVCGLIEIWLYSM